MNDTILTEQLGDLLDKKLLPIKDQLDTVDMKIETVNTRVQELSNKLEQSQQETIEALSDLIHTGYNLHEKRIKQLEKQASLP